MRNFVKTDYGLLPASAVATIEKQKRDIEAKRTESASAYLERRAKELNLPMATMLAMWQDGQELFARAMKKAVAAIPQHVLEKAYPCAGCRVIVDDKYKSACQAAKVPACFTLALLKGCPDFKPRLLIVGAKGERRAKAPAPTAAASVMQATPTPGGNA